MLIKHYSTEMTHSKGTHGIEYPHCQQNKFRLLAVDAELQAPPVQVHLGTTAF